MVWASADLLYILLARWNLEGGDVLQFFVSLVSHARAS